VGEGVEVSVGVGGISVGSGVAVGGSWVGVSIGDDVGVADGRLSLSIVAVFSGVAVFVASVVGVDVDS
jgi:hypothetical protein